MDLITLTKSVQEEYAKRTLSRDEEDLLRAAAANGDFYVFSPETDGFGWVRAGGLDFVKDDDPAYAASFIEAFRSLCKRGYVDHPMKDQSNGTFNLTGSGFKKARELRQARS